MQQVNKKVNFVKMGVAVGVLESPMKTGGRYLWMSWFAVFQIEA